MKKILTLCISLFVSFAHASDAEIVLPMDVIQVIKTCNTEEFGKEFSLPQGDIDKSYKWLEKASINLLQNNISGLEYLVRPRILHENKENIFYLKNVFLDERCIKAVNMLWTITQSTTATIQEKLKSKNKQTSSSELYIVSTHSGVNVRDNPLDGIGAHIVDALKRGIGLRLVEQVKFDGRWWGQFAYNKDGQQKLGWIEMSNINPADLNN